MIFKTSLKIDPKKDNYHMFFLVLNSMINKCNQKLFNKIVIYIITIKIGVIIKINRI